MQQSPDRQRLPGYPTQSGYQSAPAPSVIAPRPARQRYSLIRDIYWGAVLGDFAPTVGLPGAVVQAMLGYVPVVGTLTAARDAVADWRLHDAAGVILNILAAFPVLGGVAKTADVLHELHRLHRVYASSSSGKRQDETTAQDEITIKAEKRRGLGCVAFFVSTAVLALGMLYGLGIHVAAQDAAASWPLQAGTLLIGHGMLVVAIGLGALGLSVGEVICVGSRAWLGVIFLPAAIYIGLLLAGGI
ncbi:MAG: hypothetical protein ACLQUY_01250 [Ktedonobacterales bacterium]